MHTKQDYYKEVLGITLNGPKPQRGGQLTAEPFCFLCDSKDFEENKALVLKILQAAHKTEAIVSVDPKSAMVVAAGEIFVFGDFLFDSELKFPSFAKIAKDPKLKAKLWGELKSRI